MPSATPACSRASTRFKSFRRILNDRRFRDVPMVLETPKGQDLEQDRENLSTLRGLVAGRTAGLDH